MIRLKVKAVIEIEIDEEGMVHRYNVDALTYDEIVKKINQLSKAGDTEPADQLKKEIPPKIDISFANVWYLTVYGWKLFTEDFLIKDIRPSSSSQPTFRIRLHTFQYLRQNNQLNRMLDQLQNLQKRFQQQQALTNKALQSNQRHDRTPKIAFLYASPITQQDPLSLSKSTILGKAHSSKPGTLSFTTNYLKSLNKIVSVLTEEKQQVRLQVMEFNKGNFLQCLTCKIVYCLVHAEDTKNYIFGEDHMGKVVEVSYAEKERNFMQQTDLLIIHSSYPSLPVEYLQRAGRNIILINSNVLFEDDTVEVFIGELFRLLVKQTPIKQAFDRSLNLVLRSDHLSERLMCCCFHIHDPAVCHRRKSTGERYNKFHYRYHKIRCECPNRYQMLHLDDCQQRQYFKKQDLKFHENKQSLCCCCDSKMPELLRMQGKEDVHSLKFKFVFRQGLDRGSTSFLFNKGVLLPNVSLKPYKDALDRTYGRIGNWQKKNLAMAMWYRNEAASANSRFVVNFYGPDGCGKEYMMNLFINYLRIKKLIDESETKIKDTKLWSTENIKSKAHVIEIENAQQSDPYLKQCLKNLQNKVIIIMSLGKIQLPGIDLNLELKPFSPDNAYDLIVRKLQKRKLKRYEKNLLLQRLKSIPPQYASFIVKEVPKIEDNNIEEYLKHNLDVKLQKTVSQIRVQNQKQQQALVVLSQFEKITERSYKGLLAALRICEADTYEQIVFPQVAKRLDRRYVSAVCLKPRFQQIKEKDVTQVYRPLVSELLAQASELVARYSPRLNQYKLQQRLFDCTIRNQFSFLSLYMMSSFCQFKCRVTSNCQLDIEQLYQFIKENFGSEEHTKLIYPQIVYLCILVINLKLMEGPYDKYMITILKNIAKFKHQKTDKTFSKVNKCFLQVIINETAIQLSFAKRLIEQQGKQILQRDTVNYIDKLTDQIIFCKENLTNLLEDEYMYFLSVLQFDILLIKVICQTNNQPPKIIDRSDIRKIEDLLSSYDTCQSDIKNAGIIEDHAIRKEFVRLLLTGNHELRLYSSIKIKEHLNPHSDLMHFYDFLQNRLRCTSLVEKTAGALDSTKIEMLNLFVTTYEKYDNLLQSQYPRQPKFAAKSLSSFEDAIKQSKPSDIDIDYQPALQNKGHSYAPQYSPSRSFPQYLIMLLRRFRDHLKRQIRDFLDTASIFTLLTSHPVKIKNQSFEKEYGVTIEFDLKKKIQSQKASTKKIILEHNIMNWKNLKKALERGSKYLCLWFEYKHKEGDDIMILEKEDQNNEIDYQAKKISELVSLKSQFNYLIDTVFICGNSRIGDLLFNNGLCSSVVYFNINSQDKYSFYLKNVFQIRVVEYFMGRFQQEISVQSAFDLFMKYQKLPNEFNQLRKKISVKCSKKQEPPKIQEIRPVEINYMSPKVYLMKINHQLFDIATFNQKKTISIIFKEVSLMSDFVQYYKTFCQSKQTFPDEIYVVDWNQWDPAEPPVLFVDRTIQCKLTVMATRTSLLIMKNYSTLMTQQKRIHPNKILTLPRLIEILSCQSNKMITIICKANETDTYAKTWRLYIRLEPGSFRLLAVKNRDIIPSSEFV